MSKFYEDALELYNEKDFKKALRVIKKVKSHGFMSKKLLMALEHFNGNHLRTISLARELIKGTNEPLHLKEIYFIMAVSLAKLNRFLESANILEESIAVDSTVSNSKAYFELITLYNRLENYARIEEIAPKIENWQQYFLVAKFILIESAAKAGNINLLQDRLRKISHYYGQLSNKQFATVLNYMVNTEMFDAAEKAFDEYETRFNVMMVGPRMNLLLKRKQYQKVVDFIVEKEVPESSFNEHVYYILGHAYNGLERFDEAFQNYAKGANIVKERVNQSSYHDFISSFNGVIPKLDKQSFCGNEGEKNVFILGFPRSGTTLLDNIIDTQDALVLSERNIVTGVINETKLRNFKYPSDIYKISTQQLEELREEYFKIIAKRGFTYDGVSHVIEKGPHLTEMIPLIKMIFPESKIICTIRHPLDVVISCFQQNFEMNSYNAKLTVLDDIVERYINVFSLLERYEKELGIEPHYIRYEDLVGDIEGQMTKVFDYIKMKPDESYLAFNKHAAKKYVTSASRGQTDKALYTSSMYKWKNYEKQLTPHKEKLRYFIEKFGYEY